MQMTNSSTASARLPSTEEVQAFLTGKHVRLRPYVRGFMPRDALAQMWSAVEADGSALDLLYGRRAMPKPPTPYDTRGDLIDFVDYFKGDDKLLVLVEVIETHELAGFLWLDDMIPLFRGTVNLFFRKEYRGKVAFEAGRIFRDYCCQVLRFKSLWGLTPWRHSVAMGRWLGMKKIAVLPSFQMIDGVAMDVYVLRFEASNAL